MADVSIDGHFWALISEFFELNQALVRTPGAKNCITNYSHVAPCDGTDVKKKSDANKIAK